MLQKKKQIPVKIHDKIGSRKGNISMAINLIVSDMDGTLLDEKDEILPLTKKYLLKCQKMGIRLILASGRSYSRLMPYVNELEMKKYGGLLIEVNGMAINNLQENGREIFKRLMREDIDILFPFLKNLEVEIQAYLDQDIYFWIPKCQMILKEKERKERALPKDYPWTGGAWSWVTDSTKGYPNQKQISLIDEIPKEINKFGCLGEPKYMEQVYQILISNFGDKYEFVRTCPRLIEISPKGITKGQALKKFMLQEQIKPNEVLVFGDGENDVDMFEQVVYSIAMGNAQDYVKEHAYAVTESNREEGIAKALLQYVNLEAYEEEVT